MGLIPALVARLLANPDIAGLVDDAQAIAWGERARGRTKAVRLTPVWPGVEWRLGEIDRLERPRVQFDAFGPSKTDALALGAAIRAEMERTDEVTVAGVTFLPPGMIETENFMTEDVAGTDGLLCHIQDFSFFHQPG